MYITLESDYAIRIVLHLCRAGCRLDARTLSEKTGVTLRFALKIMRKLVSEGIVKSFKGTQGGYELAKKPEEISLRDVIETVEGQYYLSRCLAPDVDCTRQKEPGETCKVQAVFCEVSKVVRQRLSEATFDKLV